MRDFFVVPHFQKTILFPSTEFCLEVIGQLNLPVCMNRTRNNVT